MCADFSAGEIEVVKGLIVAQQPTELQTSAAQTKKARTADSSGRLINARAEHFVSSRLNKDRAEPFDASGVGPRECFKKLQLRERPWHDRLTWVSEAYLNAMLVGWKKSLPSIKSEVSCFIAFAGSVLSYAYAWHNLVVLQEQ